MAIEFSQRCGCLAAIAECIRTVSDPPDISHIMQGIQVLLDASIAAEPFKIYPTESEYAQIDLSKINFEALRKRFENKKPSNTDVERLPTPRNSTRPNARLFSSMCTRAIRVKGRVFMLRE